MSALAAPDDSDLARAAARILESNCGTCHGQARMSDLDLRTRESSLRGGKRGPAVAPGNAAGSLLLKAVLREGDLKMPPGKSALAQADIDTLRQWIEAGAPWQRRDRGAAEPSWWSFRPVKRPAAPAVDDPAWSANPIDAFVLSKLREKKLAPVPPATREQLVRRAYFDLHGLPPTPAQIREFLSDTSPDAWRKLIDRLLESPRYGERWGRHWLDVVRYADTGGFETDVHFLNAWRYRDYVIDSVNEDKPYNTFVQEQIAADEIWPDDLELDGTYEIPPAKLANLKRRIGTGLYTIGPVAAEYTFYGDLYRTEWQADAVETTASAFLGLTFGCARCHDHKFDPVTQRDYYGLAAFFAGSEDREIPIVSRMGLVEYTRYLPKQLMVEELKKKVALLNQRVRQRINATGNPKRINLEAVEKEFTQAEKDEYETLLRQIGLATLRAPAVPDTASVLVHSDRVHDTHVLVRGEWRQKGDRVGPSYPSFLKPGPEIVEPANVRFISERRKALAQWLTSPEHPLFARVMVNRVWQGHFGAGLVSTSNDFGRQGEPPTHPELLDWLAAEFVANGWSVKSLHRVIMNSRVYRLSTQADAPNAAIDASNAYLWRMNRKRLEAEAVRDSILATAGSLNTKMHGPPVVVPLSSEERGGMRDVSQWAVSGDPADFNRRSVYLYVKRSFRLPMLETFDAPDPASSCPRRESSTVAPQALALMNSDFAGAQAAALAARLKQEHGESREAWVDNGYLLTLGRAPTAREKARSLEFLERNPLSRLCLLWFNLNEFVYVD